MDVDEHLKAFASEFVIPSKRDRWMELLTRRGRNAFTNAHKLQSALDRRYCKPIPDLKKLDESLVGVYYDFFSPPSTTSLKDIVSVHLHDETTTVRRDAIFSVSPGRLAIYFFHENETWLCQR